MMYSDCFLYLLLAVPALEMFPMVTAISAPPPIVTTPNAECPQAGLLNEKLQNLSTTLSALNSGLDCVFSIIDEQCPCLDAGSADCFETQVSDFRTALQELIDDVANVTSSAPQDCPDRTGAVFMATCDGTDVAVVDPNGFIQNGFTTDTNVTRWSVYTNGDTYGVDYFRNDPFVVRCLSTPDGTEVVLGSDTDSPLTTTARGTGIAYNPVTEEDYVAISFDNETLNGIYAFNRTSSPIITLVSSYDGTTGQIQIVDGVVYMSDGQKILTIPTSGNPVQVLKFSTSILSFLVTDDDRIVFCDDAGAVWIYDLSNRTYRQLREPNQDKFCHSMTDNPCESLLYVANRNYADIEIYNTTSFELDRTLDYTLSTPSSCPSIGVDLTFCCP